MNALARLFALAATVVAAPVWAAGNADNGRALYAAQCSACHSPDYNGVGPAHRGVFGRAAGSAAGYSYSPALRALHLVWGEQTLDGWLADPEKVAPGQRMGVSVASAAERADLIAYLKQISEPRE